MKKGTEDDFASNLRLKAKSIDSKLNSGRGYCINNSLSVLDPSFSKSSASSIKV